MTHTETQCLAYAQATESGLIARTERRVLDAALRLEAENSPVTQEALAEALGATGGDRRPLGSSVAILKRRGALRKVGTVEGSCGFKVESYATTGTIGPDPGTVGRRPSRAAVVRYLAQCSDEENYAIQRDAVAEAVSYGWE